MKVHPRIIKEIIYMSVLAILQVANTATVANTVTAPVTPIPTPTSLIGTPTLTTWISGTDLPNAKVKYGYLAFQTYNAAGGAQGLASATGTTDWISVPHVSADFPNISISSTATSSLTAGIVTFMITGTVSYTQTSPGLYNVTADPIA